MCPVFEEDTKMSKKMAILELFLEARATEFKQLRIAGRGKLKERKHSYLLPSILTFRLFRQDTGKLFNDIASQFSAGGDQVTRLFKLWVTVDTCNHSTCFFYE